MLKKVRCAMEQETDKEETEIIRLVKNSFDKDGLPVWRIAVGGYVRRVSGLKMVRDKAKKLPEGYVLEERVLSIQTEEEGKWVLVSGFDTIGFVCDERMDAIKKIPGSRLIEAHSFFLDTEDRRVYIEDRLVVPEQELKANLELLTQKGFSYRPILITNKTMSSTEAWVVRENEGQQRMIGRAEATMDIVHLNVLVKPVMALA
jgi:hypothetical protein